MRLRPFTSTNVPLLYFIVSLMLLDGCSGFTIVAPNDGDKSVSTPVNADVTWNDSNMSSIHFAVDGADQTSAFSITNNPNGGEAKATLALAPGSHSLSVAGDYYFAGTIHTTQTSNFTVIGPFFSLSPSPNPLKIAPGSNGVLTISVNRGGGFNGSVAVTFSGFPSGVSANPTSLNIAGASSTTTVSASATATGQSTVTASGSSGTLTNQQPFTLNIAFPIPTISSVNPNIQAKGNTVAISGTNFSATCANDVISVGTVNVTPTQCAQSSLTFIVPQQAAYGATQVSVKSNGQQSSPVSFTVARTPGQFTEITSAIEGQTSTQLCPTQAVRLTVCSGVNCGAPTYPFTATFNRVAGGAQIGQPMGFHLNNARVSNLGGAGFSLCNVGAVLDADTSTISNQLMGIQFLDLGTGRVFPPGGYYFFNYLTPSGNASITPRVFRSPDGTILIVVTASSIGPSELTAAVLDQVNPGNPNQSCQSPTVSNTFSATITASNKVSASLAGTTCTINIQ
jgi:hypothetical protein